MKTFLHPLKTFLHPLKFRLGKPVMVFISRERSTRPARDSSRDTYWLGVYFDFVGRGAPAEITDYKSVSKQSLSKDAYLSLLAHARLNRRLYRRKRVVAL